MFVNSTELQNNFGKYLMLAAREEIIVTRNGTPVAKLVAFPETTSGGERFSSAEILMGKAEKYPDSLGRATYEEFLALTKDTEERYEYIDGHIFLLASPKTAHQYALAELFAQFYSWFEGNTCRPFVAPYDIELHRQEDNSVHAVQPDLMVICDLDEHLDETDMYKGVPALVVEILSESTRRKDLIYKLNLYLACGIREYWIVNPLNREVTVYSFANEDIADSATFKPGEKAASFLYPGLCADVDRLFRD